MTPALVLLGLALAGLCALGAVEARRHVQAARAQAEAGLDDDDRTPPGTRARLVASELRHAAAGVLMSLVPDPRAAAGSTRERRILLVTSSPPARGCARRLAARLRRDGWTVACVSLGMRWPGFAVGVARLAAALPRAEAPAVLVAHGRCGLAARAVAERAGLRTVVTLGTPHAARALGDAPAGIEAVAIASPDDARLPVPAAARWAGACNVSVRGVGHLGLLATPRVHALVVESLAEPQRAPTARIPLPHG